MTASPTAVLPPIAWFHASTWCNEASPLPTLFVLAVGAFITTTMRTSAIDVGIRRLAIRLGSRPMLLVVGLMTLFAIGGTTYGMWEETLGLYALLVPLALALGYDRMVSVGIIALGAGTGTLASTVIPFATGVASDAAGISISDGLGPRLALGRARVPGTAVYLFSNPTLAPLAPRRHAIAWSSGHRVPQRRSPVIAGCGDRAVRRTIRLAGLANGRVLGHEAGWTPPASSPTTSPSIGSLEAHEVVTESAQTKALTAVLPPDGAA